MFDSKIRILIVDDLPALVTTLVELCEKMGFHDVAQASDGKQAWEMIQAASPPFDLILSDWNMPNLNGLELLKLVKADSRFSKIPFLMVTGQGESPQVVEALRTGATNYLVKPFSLQSLQSKLEIVHSGYPDGNPVRRRPE